jgi:hypothetical protein
MTSGETCLEKELVQKGRGIRELVPYLWQEGRPVRRIFQEDAVHPWSHDPEEFLSTLRFNQHHRRKEGDVEFQSVSLIPGQGGEAGISESGREGILCNVFHEGSPREVTPDTPPEPTAVLQRHNGRSTFPQGHWIAFQFDGKGLAVLQPMEDGIRSHLPENLPILVCER